MIILALVDKNFILTKYTSTDCSFNSWQNICTFIHLLYPGKGCSDKES